jgi:WD40 repeat protein
MYKQMLMTLMLFVPVCAFSQSGRLPALDDATAAKSTGALSVNPDERSIAIEADGGILIMKTQRPYALIKKLEGNSPSWSPDGRSLAFYRAADGEAQIYVWQRSTDTKELRKLTQKGQHFSPAWSTDGKSIITLTEAGEGDGDEFPNPFPWVKKSEIAIFDVRTGRETHIAPPGLDPANEYEFIGPATWSKDGTQIVIWEKTRPSKFVRAQVYSISNREWRPLAAT